MDKIFFDIKAFFYNIKPLKKVHFYLKNENRLFFKIFTEESLINLISDLS